MLTYFVHEILSKCKQSFEDPSSKVLCHWSFKSEHSTCNLILLYNPATYEMAYMAFGLQIPNLKQTLWEEGISNP